MPKEKKKDFAAQVREFFGMPQPGQKKLTPAEAEKQIKTGKVPTKASEIGEPKKKKKKKVNKKKKK